MKKILSYCFIIALFCWQATYGYTSTQSLGQVSSGLLGPFGILTSFIFKACYIVGAGFLVGGIMRFVAYRKNPQQMRLIDVIFLFIVAFCMIGLPLISEHSSAVKIMHEHALRSGEGLQPTQQPQRGQQ